MEVQLPIQRMTWTEAMNRFGSDKPDLRFGMELTDVSEVVKGCEFAVFKNALEAGGSVRGINAKGQGSMREEDRQAGGICQRIRRQRFGLYCIQEDGSVKSSFAKFMKEEEMKAS